MAFAMTQADIDLLKKVRIEMTPPEPVDKWFDDLAGKPIFSDVVKVVSAGKDTNKLVKVTQPKKIDIGRPSVVPLQFPPRVKSRQKAGDWSVDDITSYEPLAIYMGSKESKMTMELKYVVTGGDTWNVDFISKAVHTVMGYFYRSMDAASQGAPLVKIKVYEIAPAADKTCTFRMNSASVAYSDEIILDGAKAYPQVTTVTLDLAMFTQMAIPDEPDSSAQPVEFAPLFPKKEWY